MRGNRGLYLLGFGTGLVLAGVAAFAFGRSSPGYRFHPLGMGADSYCFLGTLMLGAGAILYVIGALLHFHPPASTQGDGVSAGGAVPAAVVIAGLVVGVCLALGPTGPGTIPGGPGLSPEEAARLHADLLQRQQEMFQRMQPQGPGFPVR